MAEEQKKTTTLVLINDAAGEVFEEIEFSKEQFALIEEACESEDLTLEEFINKAIRKGLDELELSTDRSGG